MNVCENLAFRGMGILPMRPRPILALQYLFFLQVDILVKRTARMAVPLFIHVLRHKFTQAHGSMGINTVLQGLGLLLRHGWVSHFVEMTDAHILLQRQ